MPSTTASEILDDITTACLAVHRDVFPIPVAPAGMLPRYDAACVAVAKARTIDEVREIAAGADALRAYARQARNRQLELDAAEIRIRANRRVGELMLSQRVTIGMATSPPPAGRNGRVVDKPDHRPPTLAEAGIDKNLAHRARKLAAVPQEKFEEQLGEKRRRNDRRLALDPEAPTPADAAPGTPAGCGELIAPAAEGLAAENAALRRRVASLLRENRALNSRLRLYETRAAEGPAA